MAGTAVLIQGIKARLRIHGITYRELAAKIGISETTVKRDLSRGNFSLERLDRICDALGVSVAELVQPASGTALTVLTDAQERSLVANPRLLLVTYLVVNDWRFAEIVDTFQIEENQLVSLLLRLDQLGIVDFKPPTRVRKRTARNFAWRKDGPVHRFFIGRVVHEFFDAPFDQDGDEFQFVGGMLSRTSLLRMQAAILRLSGEFETLAHQDAKLPFEQRIGCTAILALRSWEFSEFSRLRRHRKSGS